MWLLPLLIVGTTVALSIPIGFYLAWIFDGRYQPPRWLRAVEQRLDTGAQSWKQYTLALLLFNVVMFIVAFVLLTLQPYLPLNPDEHQEMLAPTTIFNTAASFITNTNLQHYAGEVHLSYFSQMSAILWNMFVSAAVGFCALMAVIRGLRGDAHLGNFYLDMWRVVVYVFLPASFLMGVLLMADGVPMTFAGKASVATLDQSTEVKDQQIARGPVAAIIPIKHLGTNGGGFFAANGAHPYENPSAWSNFLECMNLLLFPFALVITFGRMLQNMRHAVVIYSVMLSMMTVLIAWAVYWDAMQPNPALTAQPSLMDRNGQPYQIAEHDEGGNLVYDAKGKALKKNIATPDLPALPIDHQNLGNLEGKELRFGTSAGATFAAATTAVACGSVNCMHDSLNPLAGLSPFVGMWLNCVFGGKGVGLINLLVYLIVGVFLAGLMVGRTPEYLGKKVEAREMKLAMLALLIHPILVLGSAGLFAACSSGTQATSNPGPHGFSEILYEFSSASANNGSEFGGLQTTYGFNEAKGQRKENISDPAEHNLPWDLATGLVMLLGRFIPIIAPLALVGGLSAKKSTPFTVGTLRTDTVTFGFVLFGTILLVGALLFLPAAVLGPVAEHLGPMPFGS